MVCPETASILSNKKKEKMNPLFFSIIMPAYNAERFLCEALDSVLTQSFTNFELIVINDGSTDHTIDILRKYAVSNLQVKIIDKENAGVAAARNDALEVAQGQFVMFVDSDDVIYPGTLQYLHDILVENQYDYLRFEYKTIDEGGRDLYPNYEAQKREKYCGKNVDSSDCIIKLVRNEFFSCVGVFKRSIIETFHVRLMKGCTYNEDTLFMMEFFMHSSSHSYVNNIMYGYRKTSNAVTAKFTERNYNDVRRVIGRLIDGGKKDSKISPFVLQSVVESLCLRLIAHDKDKFCRESANELAYCLKNHVKIEWKLIKLLGIRLGLSLMPLVNLSKKVLRRI